VAAFGLKGIGSIERKKLLQNSGAAFFQVG
jgi:hypothetical protein